MNNLDKDTYYQNTPNKEQYIKDLIAYQQFTKQFKNKHNG